MSTQRTTPTTSSTSLSRTRRKQASDDLRAVRDERDELRKRVARLQQQLDEFHKEREKYDTQHHKNERARVRTMQTQVGREVLAPPTVA